MYIVFIESASYTNKIFPDYIIHIISYYIFIHIFVYIIYTDIQY